VGKLSDSRLRSLKPRSKSYQVTDGGGLFAEVLPSGSVSFRYQYRIGGRKERVVIATYPGQHSIRISGQWRICFTWRAADATDVEVVDHH
jgi:hypothetical protein